MKFLQYYCYQSVLTERRQSLSIPLISVSLADGSKSRTRLNSCDFGWPLRIADRLATPKKNRPMNSGRKIFKMATIFFLYLGAAACCCCPCIYWYLFKRKSHASSQKPARNFVKWTSTCFHLVTLVISVALVAGLFAMNIMYISSAYVLGRNTLPPGIRYVCAYVDESAHKIPIQISMEYSPEYVYRTLPSEPVGYCFEIGQIFSSDLIYELNRPMKNGTLFMTLVLGWKKNLALIQYNFAFGLKNRCLTAESEVEVENFHQTQYPAPFWIGCERQKPIFNPYISVKCQPF